MTTLKNKKAYVEYHTQYLADKYGLNLKFDKKHNLLYSQSTIWYRRTLYELKDINWIIAYIDGIYQWIKIKENKSDF
jgi:hypothetical protein